MAANRYADVNVAVIGGGAMGGIFGARLADAGHLVTIFDVARPLVDQIAKGGLVVDDARGSRDVRVSATTDAGAVEQPDVALFLVKCYHTSSAAEAARKFVGDSTLVISLQNGWGNGEMLASVFGENRVAVGVTYNSGKVVGLGHVAHTGLGVTTLGPYGDMPDGLGRCEPFAAALRDAGFEVNVSEGVRNEIWKKLVLNCATLPTASLTGLLTGAIAQEEAVLALVDEVAIEAVSVAQSAGYDIDAEERITAIHTNLANGGTGKASMLQDVEAGRKTEIDVITGAILRAGAEHGVETPLNRALFALVRGLERARGLE